MGGAAGGSCYRHPLLWCWSNLQLIFGDFKITAVLYYLGNFPDVFLCLAAFAGSFFLHGLFFHSCIGPIDY